jgi:hypothetical protein
MAGSQEASQVLLELHQVPLQDESAASSDVAEDGNQRLFLGGEKLWIVEEGNRAAQLGRHCPAFLASA